MALGLIIKRMASQMPPTINPPAVTKAAIAPNTTRQPLNRDFLTWDDVLVLLGLVSDVPTCFLEDFLLN